VVAGSGVVWGGLGSAKPLACDAETARLAVTRSGRVGRLGFEPEPRSKSSDVYGPGESGNVRDLGRVPARPCPDGSDLQPELQPRTRSRRGAARLSHSPAVPSGGVGALAGRMGELAASGTAARR